jgi:hypothetical protein
MMPLTQVMRRLLLLARLRHFPPSPVHPHRSDPKPWEHTPSVPPSVPPILYGTTTAMAQAAGPAAVASTLRGPGGVYSGMGARGAELAGEGGRPTMPERGELGQALNRAVTIGEGGEQKKQRNSSRYIGVSWHNASSSCVVKLYDPLTKHPQYIGSYASDEDAARAYDCAAVQARTRCRAQLPR